MSIRFPEINISQCMYAFANTVTNPPVDYASGDPWYGYGGWGDPAKVFMEASTLAAPRLRAAVAIKPSHLITPQCDSSHCGKSQRYLSRISVTAVRGSGRCVMRSQRLIPLDSPTVAISWNRPYWPSSSA